MIRTDYNLPIFQDTDIADLNYYTNELASALKVQIDRFGSPLTFKGIVSALADLDNLEAENGDIYNVTSINKNYVYNGTEWLEYSDTLDNSCQDIISDQYDSTHLYIDGDYCIYNNSLYKANANTTGTWDATKWDATSISGELAKIQEPRQNTTVQSKGVTVNVDKIGKIVAISIFQSVSISMTSGTAVSLGTLPSGYRPVRNTATNITIKDNNWTPVEAFLVTRSSGSIEITQSSGRNFTTTQILGSMTYIID